MSVFISFASQDVAWAEAISRLLEREMIPCWMAPRDVAPGAIYSQAIIEAIDRCSALVLLLSRNANESVHVSNEVERAVSKRKPIFPVRLEDVGPSKILELHISARQWIDALHPPIEGAISRLAQALIKVVVPAPQSQHEKKEETFSCTNSTAAVARIIDDAQGMELYESLGRLATLDVKTKALISAVLKRKIEEKRTDLGKLLRVPGCEDAVYWFAWMCLDEAKRIVEAGTPEEIVQLATISYRTEEGNVILGWTEIAKHFFTNYLKLQPNGKYAEAARNVLATAFRSAEGKKA